jgi:hypothetical protein
LDPELTSEGKPYGPERYKEIVRERYLISKYSNTSYSDLDNITPLERRYLLVFIKDELQQQHDAVEQQKSDMEMRRKNHG